MCRFVFEGCARYTYDNALQGDVTTRLVCSKFDSSDQVASSYVLIDTFNAYSTTKSVACRAEAETPISIT